MRMTAKGRLPPGPLSRNSPCFFPIRAVFFPIRTVLFPIRTSLREDANDGQGAFAPGPRPTSRPFFFLFALRCAKMRMTAKGLSGPGPRCSFTIVEGCDKPARPPALQVRRSRIRASCIIIAGTIGGTAASPAAGTNVSMCRMLRIATSRRGRRPSRYDGRVFVRIA